MSVQINRHTLIRVLAVVIYAQDYNKTKSQDIIVMASSQADSRSVCRVSTLHVWRPPRHMGALHSKCVQDPAAGGEIKEDGFFAGSATTDRVKPRR